jgi:hypothetical protein
LPVQEPQGDERGDSEAPQSSGDEPEQDASGEAESGGESSDDEEEFEDAGARDDPLDSDASLELPEELPERSASGRRGERASSEKKPQVGWHFKPAPPHPPLQARSLGHVLVPRVCSSASPGARKSVQNGHQVRD